MADACISGARTDAGRQWSYPLPEFGGIYTPDVTIFRRYLCSSFPAGAHLLRRAWLTQFTRRSEAAGYAFLEEPQYLSIISVSGEESTRMRSELKDYSHMNIGGGQPIPILPSRRLTASYG